MSDKKIFCPCCGKTEAVRPVLYQVDKDEWESFEDTENYAVTQDDGVEGSLRVSLPGAFIEAGPYDHSRDRCLAEYDADHYECMDCNKMFTVQR